MMKTETFWKLIAQSIEEKDTLDKNDQGDRLMEILTPLDTKTVVGFHKRMVELRKALDFPMMRDIAFMMGYKENPTAYEGFRNWVISLGEAHYKKAKKSPAHLLTLKDPNLFVVGRPYFPDLNFVSSGAFYTKTDKGILDWEGELEKFNTRQPVRSTSRSDSRIEKGKDIDR